MTICTPDHFWNGSAIGCEPTLVPWLHDHGSLTLRIQQRCNQFVVRPVRSGLARIARDESALLDMASQQLAYSREVFLYADGRPVVFAHSTCALQHLQGAWRALGGMGNRPLGAMLFAHPQVERRPLRFKALRSSQPLYRRAATQGNMPGRLWARRSLFYLHGAPLLVTEVFLPGILQLNHSIPPAV